MPPNPSTCRWPARWPRWRRAEAPAAHGRGRPGPAVALRPLLAGLLLVGGLASATPALDDGQQAWLAAHPVRFGLERDYGPFVFADDEGRPDGLSIDMLKLLAQRTGLQLRWQAPQPLNLLLQAARARELDLLSSLRPTPERAQYLLFTQAYVVVPAVLVQRAADAPLTLAALAGRRVAVGQGYAVEAVMRQRHPQVLWQAVPDDVVALKGLVSGQFDAAVADAASVAFIERRHGLSGLQAAQQVGFDYPLSFAVRSDWPELVAVLNRAIQALPVSERQAVVARWLPAGDGAAARAPWATRLGLALLVLAVAGAAVLLWRRSRRP